MFGLMKAKSCGMSETEKHFRRLNYCGTCKTIGSLYGQKARLLLNHDTVFLAEVLSALGGESVADWGKSYQSYNCLSLPRGEMPLPLRYAATTNVILTEFKLADHLADERKRRHHWMRNAFSREFRTAESFLNKWNFPLNEVKTILESQTRREACGRSLDEFAFPTAQATAVFFREGVKHIGKSELEHQAFDLGFAFGRLVYLLDAFEDYQKDFRSGQFNAFRRAFDLRGEQLTGAARRKLTGILRAVESEVAENIRRLPISETQKSLFAARLSENLSRKIKTDLPVLKAKKVCSPKSQLSFRQRWRSALEKAGWLARQSGWQMPLVFLFVFAFALAAPAQSREAKSARQCFDLSFNLITLGAIVGAVLAFPKTHLMKGDLAEKAEKKRRWCDYCDCDCCCCCGEGCDGCDCGGCEACGCDGCCDCSCDS